MALRGEHKKQMKILSIVQAAEQTFSRKPYNSITVDEIAELAGVTKKTLYSYFPSKLALFVYMFEHYLQKLHTEFLKAIQQESRTEQAFLAMIGILFKYTWENEKFMRFFYAMDLSELNGEIPPELIHGIQLRNRGLIELTVDLIRKGQAEDFIHPDLDPELLVHVISAFNKGILIHTNKETKMNIAAVRPADLMDLFIKLVHQGIFKNPMAAQGSPISGQQEEASACRNSS